MHRALLITLTLCLTAALGCDAQADKDYPGEALATLEGRVTASQQPSEAFVAQLVWLNTARQGDRVVTQSVSVAGGFPSTFQMDLYTPPDEEALNDYTGGGARPEESRIGVAFFVAVPQRLEAATGEELKGYDGLMGVSEGHVLVYVESDIQPGTSSEQTFGPLEAGFHVMEVIPVDDPACEGDLFDCLRAAPEGLEAPIEVRIDDADALDYPNWT